MMVIFVVILMEHVLDLIKCVMVQLSVETDQMKKIVVSLCMIYNAHAMILEVFSL